MKLKLKKEYLNYSISGGKSKRVYFRDLNPDKYEDYYKSGYADFFDVEKVVKQLQTPINDELKINIKEEDDTNK